MPALLTLALTLAQAHPADFLANHVDHRDTRQALGRFLQNKANQLLDAREDAVRGITTMQQLEARQRYIREKLLERLGGAWPAKTPLNARTVATLDFPDFKIEKVIFESQPKFYVTASLYLPKNHPGRRPAILFPLGHENGAKAHEAWQRVLITFAKRGTVGFAWDTLGQGERLQFWDADLQNTKLQASTTEHTMIGLQTLLVGDPLGRYTIWDGIRALDYLVSRPEVDPARIGLTGNSGGGTHTAYLGALDQRFAAAAPSCYLTGWRRLLATIGPQDAEQCIPPMIADGLDHADFVLSFAPKPYKMLVAIRDFFSIAGARSVSKEVDGVYERVDAQDRFAYFEADDGHGYTAPRRAESFRFFSLWLEGTENPEPEPDFEIIAENKLWCTRSGQVAVDFPQGADVHSLNLERLKQLRRTSSLDEIRRFVSFAPASGTPAVTSYGEDKFTLQAEPGIELPAIIDRPRGRGPWPAVILAHGDGKSAARDEAKRLAGEGNLVLSLDLRGLGELRAASQNYGSDWARWFGDYESAMTSMMIGKPLVTQRAEDIARAVSLLSESTEVDKSRISVRASGLAAVPALFATAFDRRIASARLDKMLYAYELILRGRLHRRQWENAVAGALRHFDLPDLMRLAGPQRIQVVNPVDPLGNPLP